MYGKCIWIHTSTPARFDEIMHPYINRSTKWAISRSIGQYTVIISISKHD